MKRHLISADCHVTEPLDLWSSQLPAALRDRGPRLEFSDGRGAFMVEDIVAMKLPPLPPRTGEQGKRRAINEAKKKQADSLLGDLASSEDPEEEPGSGPTLSDVKFSMPGQASHVEYSGNRPFIGVASDSDREGFIDYNGTNVYSEWEFFADVKLIKAAKSKLPKKKKKPLAQPGPAVKGP